MNKLSRIALVGLMTVGILGGTAQAFASGGGEKVVTEGQCSEASTWKLQLSPENGRLEVELEVDQNVVGDTWKVILKDNGTVFFRGQAVTQGPSGSFEVRKLTANEKSGFSLIGRLKLAAHRGRQAFVVNPDACHACGLCATACPEKAIKLVAAGRLA
jgi:NAD-dependent dihydropyrimidine dehydrogenase PreA subunit